MNDFYVGRHYNKHIYINPHTHAQRMKGNNTLEEKEIGDVFTILNSIREFNKSEL